MPARNSGESLYNYCNRLINSNIQSDINWGKQLLSEWNYAVNSSIGIDINTVSKGSRIEAFWVCSNGHSFKKSIVSRTGKDDKHRDKCRICAYNIRAQKTRERALKRETLRDWCNKNGVEFDITVPELKLCLEYGTDYTHPNSIESNIKRKLCIDNGVDLCYIHSSNTKKELWSKEQIVFKQNWSNCIDDAIRIVTYILSVRDIDTSVINQLDYEYINAMAYERSHGEIAFEDSLAYYDSELCKEWDYNKNRIKPENYKKFSNKKVWWKCKTCGHSWQATILNRTYNRSGCPNCAGRV